MISAENFVKRQKGRLCNVSSHKHQCSFLYERNMDHISLYMTQNFYLQRHLLQFIIEIKNVKGQILFKR